MDAVAHDAAPRLLSMMRRDRGRLINYAVPVEFTSPLPSPLPATAAPVREVINYPGTWNRKVGRIFVGIP